MPMLAFNDAESVIQAGVQKPGIVQTGYAVAATYLNRGKLMPLFESLEATGPGMWVVYPQRGHLPSRTRVFIDWVSELFQRQCHACPRALTATAKVA